MSRTTLAVTAALVAVVAMACVHHYPAPPPPPPPPPANRSPTVSVEAERHAVLPGATVLLRAIASDPDGDPLQVDWSASMGQFSAPTGTGTSWTAPSTRGEAIVRAQVSDGRGGVTFAEVRIRVGGETAAPNGDHDVTEFPWPPPLATFHVTLPRGLVIQADSDTLQQAFERVIVTLRRGGFDQWGVYPVGRDGFAVAARMESILDDATPRAGGDRWSLAPPRKRFELSRLLTALVTARTGRYRILVLLVTPRELRFGPAPDPTAITELPARGGGELPTALQPVAVPAGRSCDVLVYELYKAAPDDPARVLSLSESHLSGSHHIVAAGLWR